MIEYCIEEVGKEETIHLMIVGAVTNDMFLYTCKVTVELLDDIGS